MEQLEFFVIPSPCRGVCESNHKGYCKGCLRNRNERLYWLRLSDMQKHNVLRLCAMRRRKLEQLLLQAQQAGSENDRLMEQLWIQADFDF
ncbi:hypothetical protein BGI40_01310 [Snodgrassella communis]|uniref:Putative oxidoreductase n=1 Tax=Snodgrassella communis TaxID=2946699 RepID=A0A837B1Q6_9NEIS|nr:DUF1289 domain-containing protein [Snodgrassella communis]KDN14692.1 putative oxidoreductase [Snodgrassella communis]PIT07587.1 hypothetical protein BGI29_09420 [Snodgrassella communis]PIT28008.1 hypothetical protein BGI39_06090 [Snodgrassella communis]PIT30101.1 hypothetical protein BGI38_01355 [Snodgrassella communis]PIT37261.1 hypothetical protein BGI40_01310 [Snodgrassella communis]